LFNKTLPQSTLEADRFAWLAAI